MARNDILFYSHTRKRTKLGLELKTTCSIRRDFVSYLNTGAPLGAIYAIVDPKDKKEKAIGEIAIDFRQIAAIIGPA